MRIFSLTVVLLLTVATLAVLCPSPAAANGRLGTPRATPLGSFGRIVYVQYDGLFEGRTSTGTFRVPHRITAPAEPARGNRTVLVEPPHGSAGLIVLEQRLGRNLLFSRGFAHASIGYSTTRFPQGGDRRILDPTVAGVFIEGGVRDHNGRTDDEIIVEFARALADDPYAQQLLGRMDGRYLTGLSEASDPVLRLVTSGRAAGAFDFALPITAVGHDPQAALAAGRYGGKVIVVNSEGEGVSAGFVDRGGLGDRYRFYAVAGSPHIPDPLVPFPTNRTTPAGYQHALRAHFLQGHEWVRHGARPPPSIRLKTAADGTLARDANGNAIAVDASGQPVPRLPFVELGEARFVGGFTGSYEAVRTIAALGFASHDAYLRAFEGKLADYARAGYILKEDADAKGRRAGLCAPLTFTETYRDHYDAFVAISPCGS